MALTPSQRSTREWPLLVMTVALVGLICFPLWQAYGSADATTFALHDAQLVLARSYGFDSWPKLKAYVDGVTVHRLAEAVRAGDIARVRTVMNEKAAK